MSQRPPAQFARTRGQSLVEYLVCTAFLAIFVWYALIGGSPNGLGQGGYGSTEPDNVTGRLIDQTIDNPVAAPGLVQALHKKQNDFRTTLYQP